MAGNGNSGRIPNFPLSEKQLQEKFNQYIADLEEGKFERPTVPHFCFYIGITEKRLASFVAEYSEKPESAYYKRAQMLELILQYFRGELFSSRAFSGQGGSAIVRLLATQDYGDGVQYMERDSNAGGPKEIRVMFGGDDPRAKDASK